MHGDDDAYISRMEKECSSLGRSWNQTRCRSRVSIHMSICLSGHLWKCIFTYINRNRVVCHDLSMYLSSIDVFVMIYRCTKNRYLVFLEQIFDRYHSRNDMCGGASSCISVVVGSPTFESELCARKEAVQWSRWKRRRGWTRGREYSEKGRARRRRRKSNRQNYRHALCLWCRAWHWCRRYEWRW